MGFKVAVAVPVRDEEHHLPHLLTALSGQRDAPPFVLCLMFDNCTDRSETLVRELAPSLPFRIASRSSHDAARPHAGRARRAAVDLALGEVWDGALLSTDADSAPTPDWIAANMKGLCHADVIAGRIKCDGERSPWQEALEDFYDRLHALRRCCDPVPWEAPKTHHWTSGASLAMAAELYRACGGFPLVAAGEDAALGDAAEREGWRLRRDAAVVVRTSGRRTGRVDGGFAAMLATLDQATQAPVVAHPDDEAWRFRRQAEARQQHGSSDLRPVASALGLPLKEVEQVAGECRNGEAFAARIVGSPPGGMRHLPLTHANMLLALQEAKLAGAA